MSRTLVDSPVETRFFWPPDTPLMTSSPTRVSLHSCTSQGEAWQHARHQAPQQGGRQAAQPSKCTRALVRRAAQGTCRQAQQRQHHLSGHAAGDAPAQASPQEGIHPSIRLDPSLPLPRLQLLQQSCGTGSATCWLPSTDHACCRVAAMRLWAAQSPGTASPLGRLSTRHQVPEQGSLAACRAHSAGQVSQ